MIVKVSIFSEEIRAWFKICEMWKVIPMRPIIQFQPANNEVDEEVSKKENKGK